MAEDKDRVENKTVAEGAEQMPEDQAADVSEEAAAVQTDMKALQEAFEKAEKERDEYLRIAQRTQADFYEL